MKIITCQIEGFGKLHNAEFRFEDGINAICRENGWGKSTLAAFIRAMFYGLDGDRKRSVEENERRRYRPWQGGTFGGQLVFERAGRRYRIYRVFSERESADSFMLRDELTGMLSSDFSSAIGREIFGVDRESFMRTMFIGQNSSEAAATGDINARISRLADITGDIDCCDDADTRLRTLQNSMSPDRATGSIARRKKKLEELERQIREGEGIADAINSCREELERTDAEGKALRQKQREKSIMHSRMAAEADMRAKKNEWLRLVYVIDERRRELGEACYTKAEKLPDPEELAERWNRRNILLRSIELRREALDSMEKNSEGSKHKSLGNISRFTAFVSILALFAAVLAAFFRPLAAAVVAAAGILLLFVSLVILRYQNRWCNRENHERLAYLSRLRAELDTDLGFVRETDAYFKSLCRVYGMNDGEELSVDAMIYRMCSDSIAHERIMEELHRAESELRRFESENNIEELRALSTADDNVVKALNPDTEGYADLSDRIEETGARAANCRNRLTLLRERYEQWEEARLLYEEESKLQDAERNKYELVCVAREKLLSAKHVLTSRYSDPVLSSFREYHEIISGNRADNYSIDAESRVRYEECGMPREAVTLSAGRRETAWLCLRLALIDAMYPDEKPFIIMDDPFSDFDDERIKGGLRLLEHISERYQVIYMTCSEYKNPANRMVV